MGTFLRLVIILLGLWLVVRVVRRALRDRRPPPAALPADMLRCDYCGVFVPRDEATLARGKAYCSASHADAADKTN